MPRFPAGKLESSPSSTAPTGQERTRKKASEMNSRRIFSSIGERKGREIPRIQNKLEEWNVGRNSMQNSPFGRGILWETTPMFHRAGARMLDGDM